MNKTKTHQHYCMDREVFANSAKDMVGIPYLWGGDDPSGFDCSGMVVECLKIIGLLQSDDDTTANGLWNRYRIGIIAEPRRGDLLFWFNDDGRATHVAIALNERYCVTADGGGSFVKNQSDAVKHNAFIKIRRISHRTQYPKCVNIFRETTEK